MTVQDVAKITGRNPQSIREWLKTPGCPIGTAVKTEGKEHYFYIIYEKKEGELFCVTPSESSEQE